MIPHGSGWCWYLLLIPWLWKLHLISCKLLVLYHCWAPPCARSERDWSAGLLRSCAGISGNCSQVANNGAADLLARLTWQTGLFDGSPGPARRLPRSGEKDLFAAGEALGYGPRWSRSLISKYPPVRTANIHRRAKPEWLPGFYSSELYHQRV